jgi:putative transposase
MQIREKRRKSLRLKGYDYSKPGEYFFTICTRNREDLLGEIVHGEMMPNEVGAIVKRCWIELPDHCPNIQLDKFVVMPNHVHGIIRILDVDDCRVVRSNDPTVNHHSSISPKRGSLPVVIRTFKAAVTTLSRRDGRNSFGWQRGYYEHVIRDDTSLAKIREYIVTNPQRWLRDTENTRC